MLSKQSGSAKPSDSFDARKRARRKRKIKGLLRLMIVLIPAALVFAMMASVAVPVLLKEQNGEPQQGASQTAATAYVGRIDKTIYGSGSVQPLEQPGVYAKTDGTVGETLFAMGDSVVAGEIVMTLENADLTAEIAQLEVDLITAQDAVEAVKTYSTTLERELKTDSGRRRYDEDGNIETYTVSNELMLRAPCDARVMAVYIQPGDDALAAYRKYGSVMILSTDGRMKIELEGVQSGLLSLGQVVSVIGEGIDVEGEVVNLMRRGTQAVIEVKQDDLPMNTPVSVATLDSAAVGEGILAVNKPLAISAYGGTIRTVEVKPGQLVKREDRLARFVVSQMPLYIDNASVLHDYAVAKTGLEAAQEKSGGLKIAAPVDGRVVSVDVSVGDSVNAGDKVMTLVADAGMEIILKVDELDIPRVTEGQRVTLTVDAFEGLELTGTVEKIAPLGNTEASVTTYDVYIQVDEIDERVLGGMNVSGEVIVDSAENAVLIPTDALGKNANGYFVTLESGSIRQVKTGIMTAEMTQIVSGLDAGETVIY